MKKLKLWLARSRIPGLSVLLGLSLWMVSPYLSCPASRISQVDAAEELRPPFDLKDPKIIQEGNEIFNLRCATGKCHGKDGRGGAGVILRGAGLSQDYITKAVFFGTRGAMRGFKGRLPDEQIWKAVAFVTSIQDPKFKESTGVTSEEVSAQQGDPVAGEKLFFDTQTLGGAACSNCHIVGDQGNEVGPILSKIGRRSPDYLRESLLKPDAYIVPGYEMIQIETRNGWNYKGIKKEETSTELTFVDMGGLTPKLETLPKKDIATVTVQPGSPMPSYERLLDERQLNNLLAYLKTLR